MSFDERLRDRQVRVGGVAHHRARVAQQRRPGEPAGERLQHLVAPALGLLDAVALARVGGQQVRLGRAVLERPQDLARAEHLLAVGELDRRARSSRRSARHCWSFETTGIMSTRR